MAKNKEKEISSKWTEDWVPIKNIMNGMIQLENGEYVTGVKIAPRNIFILDPGTVDINVYLSQLQILYNRATNVVTRKLIQQDMNKANAFMGLEYNVVDTEYYILFKERKMDVVQKRLHTMISNLANCGLNSQQTSNNDLRVILDNFFNGGSATTFSGMVGVN